MWGCEDSSGVCEGVFVCGCVGGAVVKWLKPFFADAFLETGSGVLSRLEQVISSTLLFYRILNNRPVY